MRLELIRDDCVCVCFRAITPPSSVMMTFMENYQWLFFFFRCNPLSRDVTFYLSASGSKITVGATGVSYCCHRHWQWLCCLQVSQWVMTVWQKSETEKKGMIWFSHCSFSYSCLCFSCSDTVSPVKHACILVSGFLNHVCSRFHRNLSDFYRAQKWSLRYIMILKALGWTVTEQREEVIYVVTD